MTGDRQFDLYNFAKLLQVSHLLLINEAMIIREEKYKCYFAK